MAKLFGAQRLVLQTIQDLPTDASGIVTDSQVAHGTGIALDHVRDWILTLEDEGYVEFARTTVGLSAWITAKGRLQLGSYEPIPTVHGSSASARSKETMETVRPRTPPEVTIGSICPTITKPSMPPSSSSVSSSIRLASPTPTAEAVECYQVVLLIHGIRPQADWEQMVRSKLAVPGQIEVIPIRYGYFDAFLFWFPFWTRNKPIERVYREIRVALQKYRRNRPDSQLSIIAHSFGTYIVGEILKREFELRFHRLILCGSVLRQDFPWEQYQGRFDDEVVNECGKADIWPVLAQSASRCYGASGTHGFGAVLVKDRFHAGGHDQYFEPKFVEKYWEPFIRKGKYEVTEFETKMTITPWWLSMLGNLHLTWIAAALSALLIGLLLLRCSQTLQQYSPTPVTRGDVEHSKGWETKAKGESVSEPTDRPGNDTVNLAVDATPQTNLRWRGAPEPVVRLFSKGPIDILLTFEPVNLDDTEPPWQYSFFRDRLRFIARRHPEFGRFIVGGVFVGGRVYREELEPEFFGPPEYFGWIEDPMKWISDGRRYVLTQKAMSKIIFEHEKAGVKKAAEKYYFPVAFDKSDFTLEGHKIKFIIVKDELDRIKIRLSPQ